MHARMHAHTQYKCNTDAHLQPFSLRPSSAAFSAPPPPVYDAHVPPTSFSVPLPSAVLSLKLAVAPGHNNIVKSKVTKGAYVCNVVHLCARVSVSVPDV